MCLYTNLYIIYKYVDICILINNVLIYVCTSIYIYIHTYVSSYMYICIYMIALTFFMCIYLRLLEYAFFLPFQQVLPFGLSRRLFPTSGVSLDFYILRIWIKLWALDHLFPISRVLSSSKFLDQNCHWPPYLKIGCCISTI